MNLNINHYFKKLSIIFLIILFIACLVLFSHTALEASKRGINLCLNIVFPSLFPFFVGSELLYKTGIVKAIGVLFEPVMRPLFNVPGSGSFPFVMGITSGYPVGAKLTVNMREEKLLSKFEAERLIAFTNNSGPLFVIGAVAVGMYNSQKLGYFLLACHIAACITVGFIFRFYRFEYYKKVTNKGNNLMLRFKNEFKKCIKASQNNFGTILGESIKNSVTMMLSIGGFIIFFSVIINLLLETGLIHQISNIFTFFSQNTGFYNELLTALISGFFEISTGSSLLSKVLNIPLIIQLTTASIIIGWGGLSVHSQVISILSNSDISVRPYFLGKLLQSVFSGFYTYIILKFSGISFLETSQVFNAFDKTPSYNLENCFKSSCIFFITCFGFLILISILILLKDTIKSSVKKYSLF